MARPLTRDERIKIMMHEQAQIAPNDLKSSEGYCTAYIDGMIACEQAQEKFKENDDRWYNDALKKRDIIEELINHNTKMRMALLIIAEHHNPYYGFSFDFGSNGVRDHFIKIAKDALK